MANMLVSAVTLAVLVALQLAATEACQDLQLTVTKVTHCDDASIVKIANFAAVLSSQCKLTSTGTVSVTTTTKATKVNYTLTSPLNLNGFLTCPVKMPLYVNPILVAIANDCKVNSCSFKKGSYTLNGVTDLSAYKMFLVPDTFAGQVSSDTPAGKACVNIAVKLARV